MHNPQYQNTQHNSLLFHFIDATLNLFSLMTASALSVSFCWSYYLATRPASKDRVVKVVVGVEGGQANECVWSVSRVTCGEEQYLEIGKLNSLCHCNAIIIRRILTSLKSRRIKTKTEVSIHLPLTFIHLFSSGEIIQTEHSYTTLEGADHFFGQLEGLLTPFNDVRKHILHAIH